MTRTRYNDGSARRSLTPVLAVLAAAVVALVWAKNASKRAQPVGHAPVRDGGTLPRPAPPSPSAAGSAAATDAAPPFTEVAAASGLVFSQECGARGHMYLPELLGSGGAFFDYDNDGDMDVYLVQGGFIGQDNDAYRNHLFRNDGSGRFEDVSAGSGADVPGYGFGCAAADYDNDGDVDLYVTRLGPNLLLRNNGDGTFSDVTQRAGVGDDGFGTSIAFLDYDKDGLLDLYVVNYVDWSPQREIACYDQVGSRDYCSPTEYRAPARDVLYHNAGDGRFEDVTDGAGIGSARGNGLGVLCTDFDADGWIDLYVANDQTPAFLWVNQHDGTFREEAALHGCAYDGDGIAIAGMGVASEDFDADGDYDLLVTNIFGHAHLFLENEGGYFEDAGHRAGFGNWDVPRTGFGVALFDRDHDGSLEGFVANGGVRRLGQTWRPGHPYAEPNQFIDWDGTGRFRDVSDRLGAAQGVPEVSRGAILGDYDNDGDLDILVTNNCGPVRLLRNDNRSGRSWTMLDLVPKGGSRNAINARVVVVAGGVTYRREVRPHVGYLGSNDPRVHVGLADATVIDRLEVTWPDGTTEIREHVPVNRHLRWEQGRPPHNALISSD